jgi:hypothetical protein
VYPKSLLAIWTICWTFCWSFICPLHQLIFKSNTFPMTRRGSFVRNPFLLVAMIAKVRDPHGKNKELFMCLTKKVYSTRFHNTKMTTTFFAAVAIWVKSLCYNGDNFKGGVSCFPECFSTQHPCLATFWLSTGNFKILKMWKCNWFWRVSIARIDERNNKKIVGVLYLVSSV